VKLLGSVFRLPAAGHASDTVAVALRIVNEVAEVGGGMVNGLVVESVEPELERPVGRHRIQELQGPGSQARD